jgi:para-nitrobenzyl esterase
VEYLGIPFAEPPVGELRFKRARAIKPWEGIFDADSYGAVSVQLDDGQLKGAEDCLTLNIQRPLEGEKLPVFLWIHGGGYNTGSASDPLYNGASFAREGIVFVSIQYRLNVLGFYDFTTYPGCEDFESNCGVSDQILAIQWVHENIAAFGGDANRVTIAGESAGGASVINMLAAPDVAGMFQQAIAESGLPNCIATHQTARENIDLFIEGMGWTEADLPKLRSMDPYEFQKGNTYMAEKHQYKNPGIFLPGPVIDDLLPERPIDAIRKGSAKGVKLIIGTNMHEGTMFVHPEKTGFPNSWAMVAEMFEKNGNAGALPAVISYYLPSDPFINFATDYAFQVGALKVAEGQREYGDVWMYRYEFVSKSGVETGWKASHAFELPCVFANKDFHFSRFVFDGEPEETVDQLIADIHTPWVSFTKTGQPDAENWPRYSGYNSKVRIFDRNTRTEQLDRTELMNVWSDMRFYEK